MVLGFGRRRNQDEQVGHQQVPAAFRGAVDLRPMKTVRLLPGNGMAVSREEVNAIGGYDMTQKYDAFAYNISEKGMEGFRADFVMALDHSGSMRGDYESGLVQMLVELGLAYGFTSDPDKKIQIFPFDSVVHDPVEVNEHNYRGIVERKIWKPRKMGYTNMPAVLRAIRQLAASGKIDKPMVLLFVGDGDPYVDYYSGDIEEDTIQEICQLAGYPVFVKFLAIRQVDLLSRLDNLEDERPGARLLDSVDSAFFDGQTHLDNHYPRIENITPAQFAEAATTELDSWQHDSLAAGTLLPAA